MQVQNNPNLKYQYHVKARGSFYNHNFKAKHGLSEGNFFFATIKEREAFIEKLQKIKNKECRGSVLITTFSQGYFCEITPVCHRVCEYQGKRYYSSFPLSINTTYSQAVYWMKDKWYLGFNDDPIPDVPDDFDYSKVKIVQEWVTGAFDINET